LLILVLSLPTIIYAFTYQGELSQTGSLLDGTADLKFSLYDTDDDAGGDITTVTAG